LKRTGTRAISKSGEFYSHHVVLFDKRNSMAAPRTNDRKERKQIKRKDSRKRYLPNLDAFSDRKDVVYVISVFNAVEESLTRLLIRVIAAPKEKEGFLKDILFNNAILPFSAKVKLLRHIQAVNDWPKIDANAFHRLMHIRNQFAHSQRSHHVTVQIDKEKNESRIVEDKVMISSVTGSGQLIAVDAKEALEEFAGLYAEVSEYLMQLRKNL
jgi:hypothetical protein